MAICTSTVMVGCMDGDKGLFDSDWETGNVNPSDYFGNNSLQETNVVTIKELKDKYIGVSNSVQNDTARITEDCQIKAIVTANDVGGNVYSEIAVDDGTASILICISQGGLFAYLPVGQEILVDLKGLYIGGYSETPIIGYPNEKYAGTVDKNGNAIGSQIYRMSFMSRYLWYKHFKTIGKPDASRVPAAIELTNSLYDDELTHVSKLVYVDGKFASCDSNTKIADPKKVESTDTGNGVNETFNGTKCTSSIIVRTSTYADFASSLIPAANVRMYGIMTRDTYKKGYQIQLRDADDITIHCDGCNAYVGSTKWTRNEDGDYVCNKCNTKVKKI